MFNHDVEPLKCHSHIWIPYDVWERDGHIHAPPGTAIDYGFVAKRMAELAAMFDMWRRCLNVRFTGVVKKMHQDLPISEEA